MPAGSSLCSGEWPFRSRGQQRDPEGMGRGTDTFDVVETGEPLFGLGKDGTLKR